MDDLGETVRELVKFSVVVLVEHLEIVRPRNVIAREKGGAAS